MWTEFLILLYLKDDKERFTDESIEHSDGFIHRSKRLFFYGFRESKEVPLCLKLAFGGCFLILKKALLQNHQQSARADQEASCNGFWRHFLMQEDEREYERQHYAQFINGNDLWSFTHLQGLIVAQPGSARSQSR